MRKSIEQVVDEIMREHERREDRPEDVPMRRRGRRIRKRPNTAIFGELVKEE